MALKIDLEKAYDGVRWDFVMDCLRELQVPLLFLYLIHSCMLTASVQLLSNGDRGVDFQPTRGFREGDLLSLYLFCISYGEASAFDSE